MPNAKKTKLISLISCMISMLLCVLALLSSYYVAMETGHVCEEEECHICACLELCEAVLHQLGTSIPVVVAVLLPFILFLSADVAGKDIFVRQTPVSKKIRLNN
ncbi:MAG: hypothetical protein K6E50_15660 [Lachnospiraceae bacterium]|nr:hypothetical protein [Lachnospiraceae bacterium]